MIWDRIADLVLRRPGRTLALSALPLIGFLVFQVMEPSLQLESGTANSDPPSGLPSSTHRRRVAWPTTPAPDTLNFR
jgi:hypothetical protein